MSRERYGRQFGGFTFLGDNADREGFFDLSAREQALRLGWSNGCPQVQELSDPKHLYYGPEWIKQRYADTNFWFGVAVDLARERNPELAEKLTEYRKRGSEEPVGYFEPESVPKTHAEEKSPMGDLYGYAISRVMIEGFGRGSSRTGRRTLMTLEILKDTLPETNTRAELLAKLSEEITWGIGVSYKHVLSHILPVGLLEENNCYNDFRELAQQLEDKAPVLWDIYKSLKAQTKEKYGIASL